MKLAIDERGAFWTRLSRVDQLPVRVTDAEDPWSLVPWKTCIYEGIVESADVAFDRAFKLLLGVPTWSVTSWA